MQRLILLVFSFILCLNVQGQVQSPNEFFPYKLGEHFMPHHSIVKYFQHAAKASNQVIYQAYGFTNENRPLGVAIVSSKENIKNIEEIRKNNLRMANMEKGNISSDDDKAIVWISCGVHGNEAGATNSAIATFYSLINNESKEIQSWLDNTVVIIDPCLNPDGYSHYADWNRAVGNKIPNPHIESKEHNEPWPGGRVNHYLFDLNRDWAWATQVETRQRLKLYNQWMPHVHVDVHEQGHDDEYYFAPAAEPFHKYITDWQGEFQNEIGLNHTKYFDDKGWLYFTREIFDLFYPSYGDTYPTFKGAIGMTYEQAGHSQAGREILIENGDTLKLLDRIEHHKTTALSTIEVASKNADRLVQKFKSYYNSTNKKGKYGGYLIKADPGSRHKIDELCDLLDLHGIKYGNASGGGGSAYSFTERKNANVKVEKHDLMIPVNQSASTLVEVLFEPDSELSDSLTYDITAWSLPYAHGLEAYGMNSSISISDEYEPLPRQVQLLDGDPYAFIFPWDNLRSTKFLAEALKQGFVLRSAWEPFQFEDRSFNAGTLVLLKVDNQKKKINFKNEIIALADKFDMDIFSTKTGFVKSGHDLGSAYVNVIKKPKLAVLSGESISNNEFGHVWHFCEQSINYPLTVLDIDDLSEGALKDYTVVIMPHGNYSKLNSSGVDLLNSWVSKGGKLIAIQGAVARLAREEAFRIDTKSSPSAENMDGEEAKLRKYGDQERSYLPNHLPGAIFKLNIDETHPLSFGLTDHYFTLKTNSQSYAYLSNGWNVAYTTNDLETIGFVGSKLKNKFRQSTCISTQSKGSGQVINFMDNPVYRGFWKQGAFLLGNAIFMTN